MSYISHFRVQDLTEELALPVELHLNFCKLIDWWRRQLENADPAQVETAKKVIDHIKNFPELEHSISNAEVEKYQPEIEMLLSPFFPPISTNFDFKAAGIPFRPMFFNPTKRFANLIEASGGNISIPMRDKDMMYIFAALTVLTGYYRAGITFFHDLHFDFYDKKTGVTHRFLSKINSEFVQIVPIGDVRELSKQDIHELLDNFSDVEVWKQKIPPSSFRFEGFNIVTLFDVTRAEAISALKYDLLNANAFLDPVILARIERSLSGLLNTPNLKAGFMLYNRERDLLSPVVSRSAANILLSGMKKQKVPAVFSANAIEKIFIRKQVHIEADASLGLQPQTSRLFIAESDDQKKPADVLKSNLFKKGIRSYLALPLIYGDEITGILELASEQPNALNAMSVFTLQEIIPLLTNAVNRLQNERRNEIEAIIRQKCTAIHPTVAWRFTEAAEVLLEAAKSGVGDTDIMDDIIFSEVYPLYGQADIQDSSLARNRSIQADMIEQLGLARDILALATSKYPLPVYQDLQFRTEKYMEQLRHQLAAGDENKIQEFFINQLGPVFDYFHTLGGVLHNAILDYENRLDLEIGMLYEKRKDYEDSVKRINHTVTSYIDKAQLSAQSMFPHYLEKYKTDGVEHNLYIGQSMVENKKFHPLYLQNLRLWQLLVMCEIENEVKNIVAEEINGLKICSLILVHSNPVNIRFRMDEKKFDVDGAYNIRYEILKKRIDKAYVKGSNERLTQPGKLAIVYSQDKEAQEYLNYLSYLQSIEYIGEEIERIELKDLQGITGLKALRAELRYNPKFEGITQSKTMQMSGI